MKITSGAKVDLEDPSKWSKRFDNLLKRMLVHNPLARAKAFELM